MKDQMIARGFAPLGRKAPNFPDANFLPIYTGMRTLRPACDYIVSAVAVNNMQRLENIEEAAVELVKDSCPKLNNTNNQGKMRVPIPLIPRRKLLWRYHYYRLGPQISGLRRRLYIINISKKNTLRSVSPCSFYASDTPGAYNVNSSSVCVRPGLFRPEVQGPRPMHPDAKGSVWTHWTRPFCVRTY